MLGMYADSKPTREQRQRNTSNKVEEPLRPSTTINEFFKGILSYILPTITSEKPDYCTVKTQTWQLIKFMIFSITQQIKMDHRVHAGLKVRAITGCPIFPC
jgi:hypothetical protein